jgi:hypothetical protein
MSLTVLPRGPESKLARKAVATDARRRASLGCGAARISPTRLRIADGSRSSLVALMSSPSVRSSWQRLPRAEPRRCHHALTLPAARYAARDGDCRRRVRDHEHPSALTLLGQFDRPVLGICAGMQLQPNLRRQRDWEAPRGRLRNDRSHRRPRPSRRAGDRGCLRPPRPRRNRGAGRIRGARAQRALRGGGQSRRPTATGGARSSTPSGSLRGGGQAPLLASPLWVRDGGPAKPALSWSCCVDGERGEHQRRARGSCGARGRVCRSAVPERVRAQPAGRGQVVRFQCGHLGFEVPSTALFGRIGNRFRREVKAFAAKRGIPILALKKPDRSRWDDRKLDHVQATRAGLAFTALSNGFASTPEPDRLRALCDSFGPRGRAGVL